MKYAEGRRRLAAYRQRIAALRDTMRGVQKRVTPEPVEDYVLSTVGGTIRLSQLFGSKKDLFVIHNMGSSCPTHLLLRRAGPGHAERRLPSAGPGSQGTRRGELALHDGVAPTSRPVR